ncbi:MAG: tetratricopeptide repeat protein [Pseudorhodoplanes sp.]|nr:tetratricopeptide repeat protein [Pseudorhodoplanes sp.]
MPASGPGAALLARALLHRLCFVLMAVALSAALGSSAPAQNAPVKGEVRVETSGGYARIVLHLAEEVETDVRQAGAIVVIGFRHPVDIGAEKIAAEVPNYIAAARRDPDGLGVRLALNRKVTVHSMAAGERVFVDLLPENWTGLPPGLPKEVIEELARRAREAEKILRAQQLAAKKTVRPARVRVAIQPTFVRYVFELPDVIPISSDRGTDDLTVTFSAPLKFDLGEARTHLPKSVKSIEESDLGEAVSVRFAFEGKIDIRSFREDNNYVVDVGVPETTELKLPSAAAMKPVTPPPGVAAPQTIPAKPAAAEPAPQADKTKSRPEKKSDAQTELKSAEARQAGAAPVAQPATATRQAAAPAASSESAPAVKLAKSEAAPAVVLDEHPGDAPDPAKEGARDPNAALTAELVRSGDDVRLIFPFAKPTPAAIFQRAATLWIIFDSKDRIDLTALNADTSGTIRSAEVAPSQDGQVVRVLLERPRLIAANNDGATWSVTIGDSAQEETRPLGIARNITGTKRPSVTIPFDRPREAHKIHDAEIGDTVLVVTGLGPARGFLKTQDFVEFRALASTHGVAVQTIADDVLMELSSDKIIVSRPHGLTLSGVMPSLKNSAAYRPMVFDAQLWGFDRQSNFTQRQYKLIAAAADAAEDKRSAPRLDLARFYLSREMFVEGKAVLDVAMADDRSTAEDGAALVLRAVANIMLNRPDEALKDLNNSVVGDNHDAPLWRAFAYARQGKWAEARQGFRNVEAAIATLPIELQRLALKEALRSTIETRDFQTASEQVNEFETIGLPIQMRPAIEVLNGRLAQGLGKTEEALKHYRLAADSSDRPSAAQGQLRELVLRYDLGDLKRAEMLAELETLTALWRGDETEIEALHKLARLYTEEHRYRDAFHVMRTALRAHPNSEMTRRIHDEAAITFDSLFLAGKGDVLPAIDAVSLFYDFRELTPIGRRGDEMIRRLADRLVSVDLLPQAAELLQHQVENRLQGAARAQVATRLAVIYLMDHKPDKAQHVLRTTRMAGMSNELRHLRLLLEARALSDLRRYDVALDVVSNIDLREAVRLRADILWSAKRYAEAAEQIELLHGDSWKNFEPLSEVERADILRAAIGYALGEDVIGAARLRERYAAKMAEGPDRHAFEIATSPLGAKASEFKDIAKLVAFDTLDNFLREMRERFPEVGALSSGQAARQMPVKQSTHTPPADLKPTGTVKTVVQRAASR